MTIHRRFDAAFWFALTVAVLLAGSVSCFSYAGMQFNTDGAAARQGFDGMPPKLRSPIAFQRWMPGRSPIAQSKVGRAGNASSVEAAVGAAKAPR